MNVNAHLDSLQSMMINTRNTSTNRTAVGDSDEQLEIMMDGWMDVFWDMADKSA